MGNHALLSALELSQQRAIELVKPLSPPESEFQEFNLEKDLIDRFSLVCFSNLIEPGDKVARKLINIFGEQGALARVAKCVAAGGSLLVPANEQDDDLHQSEVDAALQRWAPRFSVLQFRRSFESSSKLGLTAFRDSDRSWPNGLKDLQEHAPLLLYATGSKSLNETRSSVAVVGSRAVTPYGRWVTKEFCEALAERSIAVVSGGAFGVDAVAHKSALAAGGTTIAVMAGGLDRLYPLGNVTLLNEIKSSGIICSEVPPGFTPTKWRFLQRNRLIAAMTQATVVVEAGYRSGSINTANHAAALARKVGAVPGSVSSASSAGCHELINRGKATLVASPKHLLSLVTSEPDFLEIDSRLTDEQVRVLDAIGRRSSSEQTIAVRSGMSLIQCQLVLAALELEGLAGRNNHKWCRLSSTL